MGSKSRGVGISKEGPVYNPHLAPVAPLAPGHRDFEEELRALVERVGVRTYGAVVIGVSENACNGLGNGSEGLHTRGSNGRYLRQTTKDAFIDGHEASE